MKVIKSKRLENGRITLKRYLESGKFRFTIQETDFDLNLNEELEYTAESVFEIFDEMTLEYDFSEIA